MEDHCGRVVVARVCGNEIHRNNMRGRDGKVYRGLNGFVSDLNRQVKMFFFFFNIIIFLHNNTVTINSLI